jgi:hypothetical protein
LILQFFLERQHFFSFGRFKGWKIAPKILTMRFLRCCWCRDPATHLDLWTAANDAARAVAGCIPCRRADASGARRNALVERAIQQRARVG